MRDDMQSQRPTKDMVERAREQMQHARSQYHSAKIQGRVDITVRRQLASAAIDYYDVLFIHHTKDQRVKQAWKKSDVDTINELKNQTVKVPVDSPGDTTTKRYREQNALLAADPERIIELTKELDHFANHLGFGKDVDEGRQKGRIGGEDLWNDDE